MLSYMNPFEYEAATKFSTEQVLDFYIEDFNYSRFIRSRRNIFLSGERGTGKTMALLYNSLPVRLEDAKRKGKEPDCSFVGVYVPCKTHLTHKREYELLDSFQAAVLSEHYLTATLCYHVVQTLISAPGCLEGMNDKEVRESIEYVWSVKLPHSLPILQAVGMACQKQVTLAQKAANRPEKDACYENAWSFASSMLPLLSILGSLPRLRETHWSLMLDDAHDLNSPQQAAVNSWIAYRDHSLFSFKVATAKVDRPSYRTATGGAILEGHDFTLVDMEQPYQNRYSLFGKLAREIVAKRLLKVNISCPPEEFFPVHPQFTRDIDACAEIVAEEAESKYPGGTGKQKADYAYKYTRARYFQRRATKANLPAYSGFETLVHVSTGVIRNLLEPCFWMYDRAVSESRASGGVLLVKQISPTIQSTILQELSRKKWNWLRDGLDNTIEGCSRQQARNVYRLFDNVARLFRERLLASHSEPRAISFTISDINDPGYEDLLALLVIARKAQILYTYVSSAKDYGKREVYYVPNRILWPERGLDPVGQHARVSIKASHLIAAASHNRRIPFSDEPELAQGVLFDE